MNEVDHPSSLRPRTAITLFFSFVLIINFQRYFVSHFKANPKHLKVVQFVLNVKRNIGQDSTERYMTAKKISVLILLFTRYR
jgi:isochorismate hydrolase